MDPKKIERAFLAVGMRNIVILSTDSRNLAEAMKYEGILADCIGLHGIEKYRDHPGLYLWEGYAEVFTTSPDRHGYIEPEVVRYCTKCEVINEQDGGDIGKLFRMTPPPETEEMGKT